jgi:hypothetical protein
MNGAVFALIGQRDFDSLKLQTLKGLNYLSSEIEQAMTRRMRFRQAQFWPTKPSVVDAAKY